MKVLLIICTVLFSYSAFGQAGASIVNDPVLTKLATQEAVEREIIKTNGLKSLQESIAQTDKLTKQYQLAKEKMEKLQKVNTHIKQYRTLESSLKRQKELINRTKKMIADFEKRDVFTLKEYAKINENLNRLLKNSQEIIKMFDLVLKPGKTEMNDAERMTMLMDLEKELKDKQSLTEATMDYYEDIARQREVVRALDEMGKMMY